MKKARSGTPAKGSQRGASLPRARFLFFGGKGGVGKTTAAASTALRLLQSAPPGKSILLISTDPAHSLSDSLLMPLGDRPTKVAKRDSRILEAREMDAAAALDRFKAKYRRVLAEIADRGTLLDDADINELLDLGLPGMDEVMALVELGELEQSGYWRVIVDTAPSGHTTRLLSLPKVFASWITALDRLADKHRYMVAQLLGGRARRDDEVEVFLRDMNEAILRVRRLLYTPAETAFVLVAIPEEMVVEETSRYFEMLEREGVPVTDLIINRVERAVTDCPYCLSRQRSQRPWIKRMERSFKRLNIHYVPLMPSGVRGRRALARFAQAVWAVRDKTDAAKSAKIKATARSARKIIDSACFEGLIFASPRPLMIFGGKGGVGKTTAAAASALRLAKDDRDARVMIFSTDPAHSLSDSFGEHIGDMKRGAAGQPNLDAAEIDPALWLDELKQRYRLWADELFKSFASGSRWEIKFEGEALREAIELAPPGIDEIAALGRISELMEQRVYSTIVLDTAPTGHLIRFLQLPAAALDWTRALIKLLLKYKGMARWEELAEELVAISKRVKQVAARMTDREQCEFFGVAIPESMSLEETMRMREDLKQLGVPMRRLLINNVVPERAAFDCRFCGSRRRAQLRVIKDFKERLGPEIMILAAEQRPHDLCGPKQLGEHARSFQPIK
jgi:arsenite-transporting ATPase